MRRMSGTIRQQHYNHTFANIFIGLTLAAGLAAAQPPAATLTTQQQIDLLRQQLDALEKKQKADEAAAQLQLTQQKADEAAAQAQLAQQRADEAAVQNSALVTADTHGFTIQSRDGDFLLKIGADLQVDNRSFFGVGSQSLLDAAVLRRVRPTFSGTIYHYVDYYFRPDFGLGSTIIYDAYAELKYFSRAKLRVGKFKPPVGLERLQGDDDTTFVERGLPTLLVPQRDIGYQLSGDLVKDRVNYSVGVFNGVPDGTLSDTAVSDHRDYAARIFLTPFQPDEKNVLQGLGFGIGTSAGNVDGEALPTFKTFGQNQFFTFASGVTEAGHRTRLQPQMYYYLGGFGLLADYGINEEGLQKGNFRTDVGFRAYNVELSYILTGEKKSFGSPTPRKSFDPQHNGWGAWELAIREGRFWADRAIYGDGFAAPTASPREAHEWVGGVNWYLNRLFRITGDYGNTNFGGGGLLALGGNKNEEKVVTLRFQINFI
jgi:phosphate-selective porin OprO/OprP